MSPEKIKDSIFTIHSLEEFEKLALQVFQYQCRENAIYKKYIEELKIDTDKVSSIAEIPFLPVEFFKYFEILTGNEKSKVTFTSSGTTGTEQSKHYVSDPTLYQESFRKCFEIFYGDINEYCVLALLPSYLEREGSSLIFMAQDLITKSNHKKSGFYLNNLSELNETLLQLKSEEKTKTLLLGVTYALLDFVEQYKIDFPELIVMETGGMKGKRKEMVREELHGILSSGFSVNHIHSEYGMTELLSQAYSEGDGIFNTPPWMKVLIRDTNDPVKILEKSQTVGSPGTELEFAL